MWAQICRQLSEQLEREQRRAKESLAALQASACPSCAALLERAIGEQGWPQPQQPSGSDCGRPQESAQLRQLELELAQTKLALVEAQCHNQVHLLNLMLLFG
ncbi:hypothetical protein HPB52_000103 [Rhipicephalus sanguineus]|uniref:Uncharacterized protein n=1 Tax=Rhipicephalus sanguineus TaxID=34632 RepID=A0A9D4QF18_RHISA|nr:hypothetical protein HPB52_000103 [Rhipicephalus sanguineus]